jgi:hypothetical protein
MLELPHARFDGEYPWKSQSIDLVISKTRTSFAGCETHPSEPPDRLNQND